MTIKELKKLFNNLPDDTEVKVNSIQVWGNEFEACEISEAHFDVNRGFVITPTVISLCQKNEYENEATDNYKKHQRVLANLSITDIVKASDYINELATFAPNNNEVIDKLETIQQPLLETIKHCETAELCPQCGFHLFLSDLPQYNYVCDFCDKNF